jgi:hypothetical protein
MRPDTTKMIWIPARSTRRAPAPSQRPEARRQLERDLHDGAQQRFVLASLLLRQAATKARGTAAEPLLAETLEQVQRGLAELRDLAHGIHPAVLVTRGLATALEDLAARSPLPVQLRASRGRAEPAVEAAIYFTVAEALTNGAKHAQATRVRVTVDIAEATVAAEIADDGIGGAGTPGGSGLRGLADRLDAIGGKLTIRSQRAQGRSFAPTPRAPLAGLALTTAATSAYTQIGAHTSVILLSASALASGAGIGTAIVPAMTGVYKGLSQEAIPRATSAIRTLQQLGGSFGIAILAVVLQQQAAGDATPTGLAQAFGHTFGGHLLSSPSRSYPRCCRRV